MSRFSAFLNHRALPQFQSRPKERTRLDSGAGAEIRLGLQGRSDNQNSYQEEGRRRRRRPVLFLFLFLLQSQTQSARRRWRRRGFHSASPLSRIRIWRRHSNPGRAADGRQHRSAQRGAGRRTFAARFAIRSQRRRRLFLIFVFEWRDWKLVRLGSIETGRRTTARQQLGHVLNCLIY